MTSELAIEINHLSYRYKSNWLIGSKPGIKDINLIINPGEAFGFLGSNGSGKTTTIKLLLGLTKPDQGSTKIFGKPSILPEARKHVGYISEQPYFYDNLTVWELMELYSSLKDIKGSRNKIIKSALEKVKIDHKRFSRLRGLSKGQTQRVALAQALLGNPQLLVLDEPLSGLDPVGRREFMNIFLELNTQGVTIFISSHILSDVENLCQRVSIMDKGEIKAVLETGPAMKLKETGYEIVFSNYGQLSENVKAHVLKSIIQNERLYLEVTNRDKLDQLMSIAQQQGAKLERLTPLRESLESTFIELTTKQ